MKRTARVAECEYTINVEINGNIVVANIDDRRLEMDASEPEPGIYLFKYGGRVFEAAVRESPADGITIVSIKGTEYEVRVGDPRRLSALRGGDGESDGVAEIRTAMPGKIVRLLVSEGDNIEKGDGVIIVEAMKMQNEMKSPKAGVVKKINFQEGATVGAGDLLVNIE